MGKQSVKPNKNIYFQCREKLGLTREEAAEKLDGLTASRIEKIENDRIAVHPEDVLIMSEGYKSPELCNYYCSQQCPIGQEYVPEVKISQLSQIVLHMLASQNSLEKEKNRLIEITVDGQISAEELKDFVRIQRVINQLSMAADAMRLWVEQNIAAGHIDKEEFARIIKQEE